MSKRAPKPGRDWSVIISVLALVAVVLSNLFMWYNFYQPTFATDQELLQLQIVKKPILILSIYPSYVSNDTIYGNGTFVVRNSTLILSPEENNTFDVFLSNIGNAPTVAQFFIVDFLIGNTAGGGSRNIMQPVILQPGESHEWIYPLDASYLKNSSKGVITFFVVTTDGTVSKTVRFLVGTA